MQLSCLPAHSKIITLTPVRCPAGGRGRTPARLPAGNSMVAAYNFSSDRDTPLDQRVADAVQVAAAAGSSASASMGAPRLRFGSNTRHDPASEAVARVMAAAETAEAAATAASQPDSDDEDLLGMGDRKRARKQAPAQQAAVKEQIPWWQQKTAEPGARFKSPAAAAVRHGAAGRPAPAAQHEEEEEEEEECAPQQPKPQQRRVAPPAAALPATPPTRLRQEVELKVSLQVSLAVLIFAGLSACGVPAGLWALPPG